MLQVADRAAAATQSHSRAVTMQRSSEAVQHGSFASIPPICRQREQGKESISSHTSLPETSITTCLARRPRAPRHRLVRAGACSATARAKSAVVAGGPGDFAILSLALPPSLSAESAPTFSCTLPPSQSSAFCQRPSGDPQIPAHTHPQTWKCILLLRNYSHHWTL